MSHHIDLNYQILDLNKITERKEIYKAPHALIEHAKLDTIDVAVKSFTKKDTKKMMDFFKVDGIIFHDAKTCPNNSN